MRANRAVARVDIPPLGDGDGVAHAMERIVVIQRSSIEDLRGLRPPNRLGSVSQRWIALLDQGTDELERMARTLSAGRRSEAELYGDQASKLLARARVLVAPNGLTSCRGPALVPA